MKKCFIKKLLKKGLILMGIGYLDKLVDKIIFHKDRKIARILITELQKRDWKVEYIHPRLRIKNGYMP